MKGIAEAMLSGEANVVAVRRESLASTHLFLNDALRAGKNVFEPDGCRRILNYHSDKEAQHGEGHSHIFSRLV